MATERVQPRGPIRLLLVGAAAASLLPGCARPSHPAARQADTVQVTERDFNIRLSTSHVAAGSVVLHVINQGPVAHEVLVVRATQGPLPLRADGVTIDEDAIEDATVGVLEPGAPGVARDLRLHLEPGRYSLVCNMSGHFMGGMHADLEVTA